MLAGGLDDTYRQALATSHRPYLLVEVLDGAGNVLPIPEDRTSAEGGLIYTNGSVSATLSNRVTRQLDITMDETLYPWGPDYILAPYGNRLRVWRGIWFADNYFYRWVVFTGRIQFVTTSPDGSLVLNASDRANEVFEAAFIRPENSVVGNTVFQEFQRLVEDGVPDATFGPSDTYELTVPQLTWESDRSAALDEMATSASSYWYALADGTFVMRRYPFAVNNPSVLTLSDGEGGTISAAPSRDRSEVYNSITVTGERADGSNPVWALAQDTDPTSPTYVEGNFGLRHKTVHLQTPQTQGTAQSAANDYLRTQIALTQAWVWTQPPDAALELGDTVTLNARGQSGIIQVVSGFFLPLDVSGMMTVTGRDQVIGALDV